MMISAQSVPMAAYAKTAQVRALLSKDFTMECHAIATQQLHWKRGTVFSMRSVQQLKTTDPNSRLRES
jgi:hypothetical protein